MDVKAKSVKTMKCYSALCEQNKNPQVSQQEVQSFLEV